MKYSIRNTKSTERKGNRNMDENEDDSESDDDREGDAIRK